MSRMFAKSSQISYKTDVLFFFFFLPFFLLVRKSLCSNCRQVGRCFLHNSPSYEMFMKHLPQISCASKLKSFDHFPSPSICFLVCFAFCFCFQARDR